MRPSRWGARGRSEQTGLEFASCPARKIDEETLAVGSGDFDNGFQPRYGDDRKDNRRLSDFDIRRNFVLNYSYELPVPGSLSRWTGALLKGWEWTGIFTARSGVPFTPALGFDRARALPRAGGAGQRPDLLPEQTADNILRGGPDQYFDPAAFSLSAAGFFGNLGRNNLSGPGFMSWDLGVHKSVNITERVKFQFWIEDFNFFNHPNFGLPVTTVFDSAGRVATAGVNLWLFRAGRTDLPARRMRVPFTPPECFPEPCSGTPIG